LPEQLDEHAPSQRYPRSFMKTWLLNHWDRIRNSLWFVPMVGIMFALATAVAMLELDNAMRIERHPGLEWAVTTGPAARSILSSLAGALVTVTGVVFSITMLTLAQTSSMYGPRLLRSFLNHNTTQFTLAVFLGTSLYCFAVLRTIQEVDDGTLFAPHLSLGLGLLAGLISLLTFVYFIHHVAYSIQVQNVVRNVADELNNTIDRLFPEQLGEDLKNEPESCVDFESESATVIESTSTGYVQAINADSLMQVATRHDLVIRLERRPGHFIAHGTRIAMTHPPRPDEDVAARINECFLTGARRTPRQDVECAIQELVEVAVRALSPGINDPHTAISCIDYLGAALIRFADRALPAPIRQDEKGRARVITSVTSFADALDAAFDEIRQHARDSASVLIRLADTLLAISLKLRRRADRDAVLRQAAMLERASEQALPEKYDRADVRERLRKVRDALGYSGSHARHSPDHTRPQHA
jgi:uncharacterized membrane protein